MAGFKDQELGIREPLQIRVGVTLDRFRGMNLQSDPAAIGDDQFTLLENVRLDGTAIRPRPGLTPLFESPFDGCVDGIFDDRNSSDVGFGIFWTV